MTWGDWLLIGCTLVAFFGLIRELKNRRAVKRDRKLDFSKCYHNTPHAYVDASQMDIYCCDICGRPYDDVLHKTK